jgi:hypothetical protein
MPQPHACKTKELKDMNHTRQPAPRYRGTLPDPDADAVLGEIGLYLEDVAKVLRSLSDAGVDDRTRDHFDFSIAVLGFLEHGFRTRGTPIRLDFDKMNRPQLLRRLCNQHVSAIGVAHVLGLDIVQGLQDAASRRAGRVTSPAPGSPEIGTSDQASGRGAETGREQPHE